MVSTAKEIERLRQGGNKIPLCSRNYTDSPEFYRMKRLWRGCAAVFGFMRDDMEAVKLYTFPISEMNENGGIDGVAVWDNGKHYIGLCDGILRSGFDEDYARVVLLHEWAHLLTCSGHTKEFERVLTILLNFYNGITGSRLRKDGRGQGSRFAEIKDGFFVVSHT